MPRRPAALLVGLEREFMERSPGLIVVYSDVNSTIAAALVAAKLQIPVAHVEAGLRSFDMTMPEEVNRRLTDLYLVTSPEAIRHLAHEGVPVERIHFVGNPMIDTLLKNLDRFDTGDAREAFGLPARYVLATMHRPATVPRRPWWPGCTRSPTWWRWSSRCTRAPGGAACGRLDDHPGVHVLDPLGYIDFIAAVRGAVAVVTDSGGLQEETTVLGVPCLTVRPNTERPITISHGTNRLVTFDELVPAARKVLDDDAPAPDRVPPLWDGQAGPRIAEVITKYLGE